ncbi:DUF2141 domain-containing protein [Winogradskyella immobilis]|uniref:DUF2141 domain-containing protein n=1 Tax=Winogradskyella immobilis TaxID=2816852 RepID=A0ABS8ERP5_9FLAO|nr:DUF2141 domain-containing protein [Winogradskyella immobilis]MCC1484977.1 DUF2141 domain-containing protein [Winogradskyella immobilis]MCG0017069.1 DUF2141 domain-containing protein [Winogradskyella immobilis]
MKHLILTVALLITSIFSFAQETQTITVTIDNVTSDKGKVGIALHSKDTFMKAKPIAEMESSIKDGKVTVTFKNVAPGEYAILALHDANENGRMDFKENGMPLESFGASNNVMNFGPPQYEDAKFMVTNKDISLNIRF